MKIFKADVVIGLVVIFFASIARADNVDNLIQSEMQKHHVPGVECLVLKDGQPVKAFYDGEANLEWNTPVEANTVFEIGSISKQFAAASILLLAEEGKLTIDDHISKYLTNTLPAWTNITIRQLLSHTSGIHNYDNLDGFEFRRHLTQSQFISQLAHQPLDFSPGTSWSYSNSGYNLLGYIVENVSGQNYWAFLQEHIFIPLQMTNTAIRDPQQVIPHRAAGYVFKDGKYFNRDYDITDLFSAGSIVSTVSDLAKWDEALINGRLLNESSMQLWWTPARLNDGQIAPVEHSTTRAYGFGWFLSTQGGHKNIGHGGITSGFSAANELFPDDHLVVIILSNTDEGSFAVELSKKVAPLYFSKAAPKENH